MLGIAHGDIKLVCGCLAMETHFMKLQMNSSSANVASRGCLELCSEGCNWGQTIFTCFSAQRSRSVSLCGLPLRGWAVVARRRFHFTITALTVDRGSSSRANIMNWFVGNVASYDGATLKVIELFCKAILLPVFVYGDCMHGCVLNFIHHSAMAEIAESTHLKGCTHTFVYMVHISERHQTKYTSY